MLRGMGIGDEDVGIELGPETASEIIRIEPGQHRVEPEHVATRLDRARFHRISQAPTHRTNTGRAREEAEEVDSRDQLQRLGRSQARGARQSGVDQ